MDKLKAGNLPDLQLDSLGGRMDAEFKNLWRLHKRDIVLPDDSATRLDRQLMFAAIARGMLRYLEDHETDIETNSVSVSDTNGDGTFGSHQHHLNFEWE